MGPRHKIALAVLLASASAACGGVDGPEDAQRDDEIASASQGLWRIEGSPQDGDLALLQLTRVRYAGLVHQSPPSYLTATQAARSPSSTAASGAVIRRPSSVALRPTGSQDDLDLTTVSSDVLEITRADGTKARYRRSYQLYCVPTDRSIEATTLVELGKQPKVVGVNGDGVTFPTEGELPATIDTSRLFGEEGSYVVKSQDGAKKITLTFAWSDMTARVFDGTMKIDGTSSPMSCEPYSSSP